MSNSVLENKNTETQMHSCEFETYLQTKRENTTYNGIELETFGWHKELFGFKDNK